MGREVHGRQQPFLSWYATTVAAILYLLFCCMRCLTWSENVVCMFLAFTWALCPFLLILLTFPPIHLSFLPPFCLSPSPLCPLPPLCFPVYPFLFLSFLRPLTSSSLPRAHPSLPITPALIPSSFSLSDSSLSCTLALSLSRTLPPHLLFLLQASPAPSCSAVIPVFLPRPQGMQC